MAELWLFSHREVAWFCWEPQGTKEASLGVHLYLKDPKSVQKWLICCYFPTERLRDSIENHMGQKGDPWVLICTKKIKNLYRDGWVKAIFPLRCCLIPLRTTWDKRSILGCSFVPKRFRICQEMAELWLFSHKEVAWFHWEPHGTKRYPWVFICTKKIQNPFRNCPLMGICPLWG